MKRDLRFNRCGKCDRKIVHPGLCGGCASRECVAPTRAPRAKKPKWSTAKPKQGARYRALLRCERGHLWRTEVEQRQAFIRGAECPECKSESIEVDRGRSVKGEGQCTARCWNATTEDCTCVCYFANHRKGPPDAPPTEMAS